MHFALLVIFAFGLAIIWGKRASRQTYLVLALAAAAATVYFMR
jgi:hypothetical protein